MSILAGIAAKLGGKAAKWAMRQAFGSGGSRSRGTATPMTSLANVSEVGGQAIAALRGGPYARAAVTNRSPGILNPNVQGGAMDFINRLTGNRGPKNPNYIKKYKRMNPMNVRAMRRAVRRLNAGEKLFKDIFRINHGHAATHVVPKRPKRRS